MLPLPPCTRREPAHHRSLLQQHGEDTVVISECSERQLESDHVVVHVAQWKLPPLVRPLLARRYDAVQWSRMCLQKVVAPWSAHHLQTPAPAWHLPALPSTLATYMYLLVQWSFSLPQRCEKHATRRESDILRAGDGYAIRDGSSVAASH